MEIGTHYAVGRGAKKERMKFLRPGYILYSRPTAGRATTMPAAHMVHPWEDNSTVTPVRPNDIYSTWSDYSAEIA